jgi:hypothetical protein
MEDKDATEPPVLTEGRMEVKRRCERNYSQLNFNGAFSHVVNTCQLICYLTMLSASSNIYYIQENEYLQYINKSGFNKPTCLLVRE